MHACAMPWDPASETFCYCKGDNAKVYSRPNRAGLMVALTRPRGGKRLYALRIPVRPAGLSRVPGLPSYTMIIDDGHTLYARITGK